MTHLYAAARRARLCLALCSAIAPLSGCAPRTQQGSVCNLAALASWTKADFDSCFGGDAAAGLQPIYVPENGQLMVDYAKDGVSLGIVFSGREPSALPVSLSVSLGQGYTGAADLLQAVGLAGGTLVAQTASMQRYSGIAPFAEVTAVRGRTGGHWTQVTANMPSR